MSILIQAIDMPEFCAKCFAFDGETCECNLGCERTCNPFDGRYISCRLNYIPNHGRLGDLDALRNTVEMSRLTNTHTNELAKRAHVYEHDYFLFLIRNAPTIISEDKE